MKFDDLSNRVIGCAIEVHKHLGPGLLESTYEQCLAHELSLAGITFKIQPALPVAYKGLHLDCGYRIDLLIEDAVIVELKSVAALLPIHDAQNPHLHEARPDSCRAPDELQRHPTQRRHQTLRPLTKHNQPLITTKDTE